jgi:hypothetical protein
MSNEPTLTHDHSNFTSTLNPSQGVINTANPVAETLETNNSRCSFVSHGPALAVRVILRRKIQLVQSVGSARFSQPSDLQQALR